MEQTLQSEELMSALSKPPARKGRWQRIYRFMGFNRGYNLVLFIIFGGAMWGFSLARLSYLNVGGNASNSFAKGASPGEWFWYREGAYRVGITLHLGAVIPAGLLMVWQFIPIIRHKALIVHRINGYIVILLSFIGLAGALMICRHSFGGEVSTQAGVGALAILTTISISMAYYNIKCLQIDQHRAWMLRAMFYMATIITLRIIMTLSALITTQIKGYYVAMPCEEIRFLYGDSAIPFTQYYPQCDESNIRFTNKGYVAVEAGLGHSGRPEEAGAGLGASFGMATWMALVLHLIGVEIYLALTPAETERLRMISYEKQLEAGYKFPGSAGLTIDRWGDAPAWHPSIVAGTIVGHVDSVIDSSLK